MYKCGTELYVDISVQMHYWLDGMFTCSNQCITDLYVDISAGSNALLTNLYVDMFKCITDMLTVQVQMMSKHWGYYWNCLVIFSLPITFKSKIQLQQRTRCQKKIARQTFAPICCQPRPFTVNSKGVKFSSKISVSQRWWGSSHFISSNLLI